MRVLAIETSERVGTLAALQATEDSAAVVRAVGLPSDQRSARSLVPTIHTLLNHCGWTTSQLDLICVTTGPGSFTGLRIGVTTAKTLAYATGAELVEVHTLAAIAGGVAGPCSLPAPAVPWKRFWALLDAQRQELFVAKFQPGWQPDEMPETRILGIEQWLQELRPSDVVSGPPLQRLAERLPEHVQCTDPVDWRPRAETVGQLGVAVYHSGSSVDAMQLVPRYYRKSAAEEKADHQP